MVEFRLYSVKLHNFRIQKNWTSDSASNMSPTLKFCLLRKMTTEILTQFSEILPKGKVKVRQYFRPCNAKVAQNLSTLNTCIGLHVYRANCLMPNKMIIKFLQNSEILPFHGMKSEIYL